MVRWVCPENGHLAQCTVCHVMRRHHCETLAPAGKAPMCPTHDIPMVKGKS